MKVTTYMRLNMIYLLLQSVGIILFESLNPSLSTLIDSDMLANANEITTGEKAEKRRKK